MQTKSSNNTRFDVARIPFIFKVKQFLKECKFAAGE